VEEHSEHLDWGAELGFEKGIEVAREDEDVGCDDSNVWE
jgi:hypothetical protein